MIIMIIMTTIIMIIIFFHYSSHGSPGCGSGKDKLGHSWGGRSESGRVAISARGSEEAKSSSESARNLLRGSIEPQEKTRFRNLPSDTRSYYPLCPFLQRSLASPGCHIPVKPGGCKQGSRQACRHAGRKAARQEGRTSKQAGRQASRQAGKQASRQAGRQAGRRAGRRAGWWAGWQASRRAGGQACRRSCFGKGQMGSALVGPLPFLVFVWQGPFGYARQPTFIFSKVLGCTVCRNLTKTITFAAAPSVLTPLVRNQMLAWMIAGYYYYYYHYYL